jgi:hypothetical protein
MKKYRFLLIMFSLLGALVSCQQDEVKGNQLLGKWKLIEQLADPGDGSGVFTPINSDMTISLFNDSTFTSSGSLCMMNSISSGSSQGSYSPTKKTITPNGCSGSTTISYEIKENYLILYFLCVEACAQKYKKVE